jgi:hypothetical protein
LFGYIFNKVSFTEIVKSGEIGLFREMVDREIWITKSLRELKSRCFVGFSEGSGSYCTWSSGIFVSHVLIIS